jgi:hypothetical protein
MLQELSLAMSRARVRASRAFFARVDFAVTSDVTAMSLQQLTTFDEGGVANSKFDGWLRSVVLQLLCNSRGCDHNLPRLYRTDFRA